MSVTQLPHLRPKRQRAEQFSEQSIISQLEPDTKKQKRDPASRVRTPRRPPEFWDSLSTIWLTKATLRELDRRHSVCDKYTPCRDHRRSKRPLTRHFYFKLQGRHPVQYAPDFLSSCGPDLLKEIKALSNHGGPDLSDLRNSYGHSELAYDSNAYTIASTYHDGTLKLYTSHPIKTVDAQHEPEYIMTQLNSWSMTGNLGTFQQGATWYRNARDWTKERRDEFVETANATLSKKESQKISSSQKVSVSVSTGVSVDSDSSSGSSPTEIQDTQWSFAAPIEDVGEEAEIPSKN
ncbi:hypothetical protein ACJ72_00931 [Emergomyces africanus]|uniref:Uncharacterized protein n=1 Tax=Emergomyces africanus TaxID=1955775 RepID=A0A1B7P6S2_9EURO|nr:hypothetical protein ACJ72_00931 [Emergomyces africanus]